MKSKSKGPSLPAAPSFQADPYVKKSEELLFPTAEGLTKGRFMNSADPTVGFLNPLVSLNPEATKMAVGLATRDIQENQDVALREIMNQLAANNQLESSVTVNRLSDLGQKYGRDIADVNTRFQLADVERTMANLSDLFKTGLSTGKAVGDIAAANQQQMNQFALANYENQVAAAIASQPQQSSGGLMGGLTGALGGGLSGFALSGGNPFGAILGAGLGGASGYFGPSGTGGGLLQSGAMAQGLRQYGLNSARGGGSAVFANSTASDDPFDTGLARQLYGSPLMNKYGYGSALYN